jgi:hypothetical protein
MSRRSSKRAKGAPSSSKETGGEKGQDANKDGNAQKNVASMSAKELKELLKSRGIDTSDCLEKADLLSKLQKSKEGGGGEPVVVSKFFASSDVPKLTKYACAPLLSPPHHHTRTHARMSPSTLAVRMPHGTLLLARLETRQGRAGGIERCRGQRSSSGGACANTCECQYSQCWW